MKNIDCNFLGERPFACDICQKRFTLKHSMMRHRRRHTEGLDDAGASYCSDDDNMSLMTTDDRDGNILITMLIVL